MEPIHGDTLRGHLETMVLAALERGEAHGFGVWRRLEASGRGALQLKEGSLYPALYRLEKAGLVHSVWQASPGERRGPRRRVYCLTSKGERRLAAGRKEWRQFVLIVGTILGAAT
jgi:DNA-binding PadR family transcriptional regulator